VIFRRLGHDLAVERMLDAPLDQHGDRLVHLVARHTADFGRDQRLANRRGFSTGARSVLLVHTVRPPWTVMEKLGAGVSAARNRASSALRVLASPAALMRPFDGSASARAQCRAEPVSVSMCS